MLYKYEGPVWRFENIVIPKWIMYTHAKSDKQALNQLKYKAKKVLKLSITSKVDLDEKYLHSGVTYSSL